jgi:hypothetical protein
VINLLLVPAQCADHRL